MSSPEQSRAGLIDSVMSRKQLISESLSLHLPKVLIPIVLQYTEFAFHFVASTTPNNILFQVDNLAIVDDHVMIVSRFGGSELFVMNRHTLDFSQTLGSGMLSSTKG